MPWYKRRPVDASVQQNYPRDFQNEPWFANVCKALGITYSGHTLDRIKEDWKGVVKLTNPDGGLSGSLRPNKETNSGTNGWERVHPESIKGVHVLNEILQEKPAEGHLNTNGGEICTDIFEGQEIRRVFINGSPWWIAQDVCNVLEIARARSSTKDFDPDEKGAHTVGTPGGPQSCLIVSEPGLYRLILKSRKPQARAFKRWIVHEILPTIRKTGSYSVEPREMLVARALLASDEIIREQSALIHELVPKAESFDSFLSADNNRLLSMVAKDLKLKPNKLFCALRADCVIFVRDGSNVASQEKVDAGLFTHRTRTYVDSEGQMKNSTQLLVTPKGQEWLAKRYGDRADLRA